MSAGGRGRAVTAVCVGWGVAGAGSLAAAWSASPRPAGVPWLALALTVGLVAAQLFPLHLRHTGDSEALRLEEAFFVPMLWLLSAGEVLTSMALAVGLAAVISRRGPLKASFNVGMMVTASGLGIVVARALGFGGRLGLHDVLAVSAGALVYVSTSAVAVAVVISLAQGAPVRGVLLDGLWVRVATWLGSISLGVLVLMAADSFPVALAVALVPAVVLQLAYSGAMRQWHQRQQVEALYDAAARIRGSADSEQVRHELVSAAQSLLGAGSARVVHDPAEPAAQGALRVPLDGAAAVEVAGRATGGDWSREDTSRLQALAGVASGALTNALLVEQLQAVTGSLGEGVLALDAAGSVTFVNPAAARLLGRRAAELVGRPVSDAVDPHASRGQWVHLPRLLAGETLRVDEFCVTRTDGEVVDVALTASPVVRDGEVVGAVLALRDVRDRKVLERRLMHQAFHDQLTGLPNRALFLDRLEHARARRRDGRLVAVLFVDLDRFKVINDSLGHGAGDDVLGTVASRLVGAVRPGDTVARFGGDEFAVLLEGVQDRTEAVASAARLLTALLKPLRAGDRDVVVTASIGVAMEDPDAAGPQDLLAAADVAMYEAKNAGGARVVLASQGADDAARAKLDLELELRRGIEVGELEVEYQPVVHAVGEHLHGFEALVRWNHPTRGRLAPAAFMDVAEETGLVIPLGQWVLERACRAAKEWDLEHPGTEAVMAVNLSARQFSHPDLCARVAEVLDRVGLHPSRLTLEITETVLMEDTARTVASLQALRDLGVRLAIDDFGTGYSSLSYLKRFPVDVVKIDKSFVDGIATDTVDREIVAAVIRLADAVGMQTVAEGVEQPVQLERLQALGCSFAQGYLISRPAPLRVLHDRLAGGAARGVPAPRAYEPGPVPAGDRCPA